MAVLAYWLTYAIFLDQGTVRGRLLSLRAYDALGMMLDADVVDGGQMEGAIARLFQSPDVAYIHAHNAKRGCYSGRIDRA